MQKKVIKFIIGYILLLSVVGGGLLIKHQFDSIPVVDDALIQELLESTDIEKVGLQEKEEPPQTIQEESSDQEETKSDYWKNYYQETEAGEVRKNPVVSQIEKKITAGDKLRIMNIVKKNLTSDDIQLIFSLSKSGFTSEEQTKVKSLLSEKMGEEEKKELKLLLLKYL